ncbi:unnamed protein product [Durusdinium trenchii]|uniref:Amidohydrolase-related domain-containing protein n=1 Tax=Durusdinium trenchii TaxID=1381693 RepID=A0ABP0Q0Y6_9DINO
MRATRRQVRVALGWKKQTWPQDEWVWQYEESIFEDAIDPEIAIVDAHHHFFDPVEHEQWPVAKPLRKLIFMQDGHDLVRGIITDPAMASLPYCFGERAPLLARYKGPELLRDIKGNGKGHRIVNTVFIECGWKTPGEAVQCMEPVKEADMVSEVHRQFPELCGGIVAFADLRLGKDVEPALKYYKANPLVKGIRHSLAFCEDPLIRGGSCPHCNKGTAYDEKFREGFALLEKYGFVYDCWLFHEQIDALEDLAKAFPKTTIICDHMAYPPGPESL